MGREMEDARSVKKLTSRQRVDWECVAKECVDTVLSRHEAFRLHTRATVLLHTPLGRKLADPDSASRSGVVFRTSQGEGGQRICGRA